mmetsp:Transcript_11892/g.30113  ORF Transcript_11892/g.30113 Transcript_11892/m.30113 type:complete len:332 (-) Transcript_11892:206-1201(-)
MNPVTLHPLLRVLLFFLLLLLLLIALRLQEQIGVEELRELLPRLVHICHLVQGGLPQQGELWAVELAHHGEGPHDVGQLLAREGVGRDTPLELRPDGRHVPLPKRVPQRGDRPNDVRNLLRRGLLKVGHESIGESGEKGLTRVVAERGVAPERIGEVDGVILVEGVAHAPVQGVEDVRLRGVAKGGAGPQKEARALRHGHLHLPQKGLGQPLHHVVVGEVVQEREGLEDAGEVLAGDLGALARDLGADAAQDGGSRVVAQARHGPQHVAQTLRREVPDLGRHLLRQRKEEVRRRDDADFADGPQARGQGLGVEGVALVLHGAQDLRVEMPV